MRRHWFRARNVILTDFVKVKRIFAGYGTIEPGLEVRDPVMGQGVFAAHVCFAHPGHPGENALAAVDVLDGGFAEEEEHVLADVVRAHKVRFWKKKKKSDDIRDYVFVVIEIKTFIF